MAAFVHWEGWNNCTAATSGGSGARPRDEISVSRTGLGNFFVSRGFRVLTNWFPSAVVIRAWAKWPKLQR